MQIRHMPQTTTTVASTLPIAPLATGNDVVAQEQDDDARDCKRQKKRLVDLALAVNIASLKLELARLFKVCICEDRSKMVGTMYTHTGEVVRVETARALVLSSGDAGAPFAGVLALACMASATFQRGAVKREDIEKILATRTFWTEDVGYTGVHCDTCSDFSLYYIATDGEVRSLEARAGSAADVTHACGAPIMNARWVDISSTAKADAVLRDLEQLQAAQCIVSARDVMSWLKLETSNFKPIANNKRYMASPPQHQAPQHAQGNRPLPASAAEDDTCNLAAPRTGSVLGIGRVDFVNDVCRYASEELDACQTEEQRTGLSTDRVEKAQALSTLIQLAKSPIQPNPSQVDALLRDSRGGELIVTDIALGSAHEYLAAQVRA